MKVFQHICLLFLLSLTTFFISCNTTATPVSVSDDATVKAMYFQSNDSSPNLSKGVFIVDHEKGLIYNPDSLPYKTRVDSAYAVFSFASTDGYLINDTFPETSYITSKSYNYSKPVKITNYASDKKSKKEYTIIVNVHKVETYLHVWKNPVSNITEDATDNQKAVLLNNKYFFFTGNGSTTRLYSSADASTWSPESTPAGLPAGATFRNMIVYNNQILLLHNGNELYTSKNALTWEKHLLIGDNNYDFMVLLFNFKNQYWSVAQNKTTKRLNIASSKDGLTWTVGNALSTRFPVSDFAATTFTPRLGREKVIIVGGKDADGKKLNTRWSAENDPTTDSLHWVNLNNSSSKFDAVSGAAIAYYGSKLILIGGADTYDQLRDTSFQMRQSIDEGLTWAKPDTTQNKLPASFKYRTNSSLIHNKTNNTLYIIGGKSILMPFSDVWTVKANFYNFVDPSKY